MIRAPAEKLCTGSGLFIINLYVIIFFVGFIFGYRAMPDLNQLSSNNPVSICFGKTI